MFLHSHPQPFLLEKKEKKNSTSENILLKTGSGKIIDWLGRYSFFLGFIRDHPFKTSAKVSRFLTTTPLARVANVVAHHDELLTQ